MSVLAVVTDAARGPGLARLGRGVAQALDLPLVLLCLWPGEEVEERLYRPGVDDRAQDAPEPFAAVAARVATWELAAGEGVEVRGRGVRRPVRRVLEEIDRGKARYLLVAQPPDGRSGPFDDLARPLFQSAPCHTILVRPRRHEEAAEAAAVISRILVPTAGGPHAEVALRLGERLARRTGGWVSPMRVEPDVSELSKEVGARMLEGAIEKARLPRRNHVKPRVVLADRREAGIAAVAEEGYDLLLLGASNAGSLRRLLFATLPDRLMAGREAMDVAVVRCRWRLADRLRARIGRWLDLTIPQMEREERVALYERVSSGSLWNFDFMALIGLATAIATMGLLQNSAAVVIGAMLVAPLMTPILGSGLALVQGNWPLAKRALRAIVLGYLLALGIGVVVGAAVPGARLTSELTARGGPSLLDMGVALLSGLAAAHCLGRPDLLSALPGVAIAAALVPPIATTGVCLALGEPAIARGAALLFGTNVLCIILGAATSFYAGGVRGKAGQGWRQRWVRLAFLGLLLGVTALTFPLSRPWRLNDERAARVAAEEALTSLLAPRGVEVASLRRQPGSCELRLLAPEPPGRLEEARELLSPYCGQRPVVVRTELVSRLRAHAAEERM